MKIEWQPREPPLGPVAVVAFGAAARKLAGRARLEGLTGVAGANHLLLIGGDLPWADGAIYLGRDPAAPSLLLPTTLQPSVPADWLERALLKKFPSSPLAVVGERVIDCHLLRSIAPDALARWAQR